MKPETISETLNETFGSNAVEKPSPDTWQVNTGQLRLLVILSKDNSLLRLLIPIALATEAQPYLYELLEANFEQTQEARYAFSQGVLWAVFIHSLESLTQEDFKSAIASVLSLHEKGLSELFQKQVEQRIRNIIKAAKLQDQDLETTLKTIERLYHEGILGGLQQDPKERQKFIESWQYQLKLLWPEVDAEKK